MSAQHTRAAQLLAEILIPEGIDRRGRPTRLKTCYGDKTRAGLADLIDRETRTAELIAMLKETTEALKEARRHVDDHRVYDETGKVQGRARDLIALVATAL